MKIRTNGDNLKAAWWVADDYQAQPGETLREAASAGEVIAALNAEADRRVDAAVAPGASGEMAIVNRKLNLLMAFCQILDRAAPESANQEDRQRREALRRIASQVEAIRALEKQKAAAFLAGQAMDANDF